jgi:hypothetical protein
MVCVVRSRCSSSLMNPRSVLGQQANGEQWMVELTGNRQQAGNSNRQQAVLVRLCGGVCIVQATTLLSIHGSP